MNIECDNRLERHKRAQHPMLWIKINVLGNVQETHSWINKSEPIIPNESISIWKVENLIVAL